jgi:YARHG domain
MKRCPTCQRTYNDDSLRFCLQDGATLVSVSDASRPYDSDATLVNAIAPDSRRDTPTEVFNPRVAPTIPSPKPAADTTPQQRMPTAHATQGVAPIAAATPNRALTAGVIVIAVLLLALVGIGVALLLQRGSSDSDRAIVTNADNKNGSANRNENTNANSNANTNVNSNASPVPTASSPKPSPSASTDNGREAPPPDSASRVEAKILRDSPLTESDLAGLTPSELRRLRNAVYARHGRTFDTPELQRYFDSRPWYRPRSDYSEQDLTSTDRANIRQIQAAEGGE